MASMEMSIRDAVLPSDLANAALFIAAPSLGCINTYTKALVDLYREYSLPIPDLERLLLYRPSLITSAGCQEASSLPDPGHAHQYKLSLSSSISSAASAGGQEVTPVPELEYVLPYKSTLSSSIAATSAGCQETTLVPDPEHTLATPLTLSYLMSSTVSGGYQEEAPDTMGNHEPNDEIKSEYVDPEFVQVKHERIDEYTDMNMPSEPSAQPKNSLSSFSQPPRNVSRPGGSSKRKSRDRKYQSSKRRRCFPPSWLKEYHWLAYSRERNVMYCSVCRDNQHLLHRSKINKLMQGSDYFHKGYLNTHEDSKGHNKCLGSMKSNANIVKYKKILPKHD